MRWYDLKNGTKGGTSSSSHDSTHDSAIGSADDDDDAEEEGDSNDIKLRECMQHTQHDALSCCTFACTLYTA
jgi:hypothetical protein